MHLQMNYRKSNFFEKSLLIIGLAVIFAGFFFINQVFAINPYMDWDMLQTIFLWFVLIALIVVLATEEDVKEELAIIIKEQIEETKILKDETQLLREISQEQLQELRLMSGLTARAVLPKKVKKERAKKKVLTKKAKKK